MTERLERIQGLLQKHDADAALITFLPDIQWTVGFTGSNGILIVNRDRAHFVTDGRYKGQALEEVTGAEIHVPGYKLYDYVEEEKLLDETRRVIFQSDHLSVDDADSLIARFGSVDWIPVKEMLVEFVGSKTEAEIAGIRAAQTVTEEVFEYILRELKSGVSERDIAAEIVYQHLRRGADRMAFDPIVATGDHGALPHARPSNRKLKVGDLVVLDFGCYLDGYASDMTRTIAIGEPGEEARKVYGLVLEGQLAAIDAARAGIKSDALDAAARDVIEAGGYGDAFSHSLGHGLGLQVHEWPRASYLFDYELPENAVITIEPGVYLLGQFGVRIEDIIVLRAGGCEVITKAPKELIVL